MQLLKEKSFIIISANQPSWRPRTENERYSPVIQNDSQREHSANTDDTDEIEDEITDEQWDYPNDYEGDLKTENDGI